MTADTGGHIAYVLGAAAAQAEHASVGSVTLVTRRFDDRRLGLAYARADETISPKVRIARIATSDSRYLEKEALSAELPVFTQSFIAWLERAQRLPSVIHAHFADAASVALAAREVFGIPVVYTPHALGLDKLALRKDGTMSVRIDAERRAVALADAMIVSSRDEVDRQVAAYDIEGAHHRVHVVPPGVPVHAEGERIMPPLAFADPRRPLLLAIARPMRKKNLVAVALAFAGSRLRETTNLAILAGQHEAAQFGEEEREVLTTLEGILAAPALRGCVALPPRHGSADVAALYREAAQSGGVFVSPALHEPFGLTLLEAAAAGLPVVATANGGAADIVRLVGHGLTVDPHDGAAIAEACLRIVDDPQLHRRLSRAAARSSDIFSWDRYAKRSLEIYAAAAEAATTGAAAAA